MLFHTPIFLFFFAAVLLSLAIFRGRTPRRSILLVASYLFYGHWDWRFLSLIAISTLVDFAVASRLEAATEQTGRRRWLLLSLSTNLGLLAIFKYGNFLLAQIDAVFGSTLLAASPLPGEIPVGISFYTFQTLSYTIDVYRRSIPACRSLLDFSLYVAFFPQLVAGPIVRASELIPQLTNPRDLRIERIASGLQRFLLGVFKKVVIADNAAVFVDAIFSAPGEYSGPTLWCAAFAFALQIYCDFSGYTDMALGIASMLGIKLPENFRSPYLSTSITEFWRRWHISLSSWLRDYLFIPLGGSRRAASRIYFNLMATMLLGGLWHGASWTFVFWGSFHGALLAIERAFGWREARGGALRMGLRWLLTLLLVCLAWVAFRAESFEQLWLVVTRMFTAWSALDASLTVGLLWMGVLLLLAAVEFAAERSDSISEWWSRVPAPAQGLVMAAAVLVISYYRSEDVAFLYFQF